MVPPSRVVAMRGCFQAGMVRIRERVVERDTREPGASLGLDACRTSPTGGFGPKDLKPLFFIDSLPGRYHLRAVAHEIDKRGPFPAPEFAAIRDHGFVEWAATETSLASHSPRGRSLMRIGCSSEIQTVADFRRSPAGLSTGTYRSDGVPFLHPLTRSVLR